MKKYIIFDLDWTLIDSHNNIKDIILKYFKKNDPEVYDKVRYTLDFNKISSIKELLENVYSNTKENTDKKHNEIYKYLDEKNHESKFIEWTIKKIIELKDRYKLYLSTWSSTKFAEEILEIWWIKKYFEMILWSEKIQKSEEHLDIFMENSNDPDFFKLAISIWDSPKDDYFAKQRNIDFIKIWEKYKSVSDIKNI